MKITHYLPEWKVYLWEKLLLSDELEGRNYRVSDFIFFEESEQRDLIAEEAQGSVDLIEREAYLARIEKRLMKTDIGPHDNLENRYYYFRPQEVLKALIELHDNFTKPVTISNIRIPKGYLDYYQSEERKIAAQKEKANLIARSMAFSHHPSTGKVTKSYRIDNFCSLGEKLFNKVKNGEELSIVDIKIFAERGAIDQIWKALTFNLKINKVELFKKLDGYITAFMLNELDQPRGVRYYGYRQQREKICASILIASKKYDNRNLALTFNELAKLGGWEIDKNHIRFYETIIALARAGNLAIKNFRKEEVVFKLTDEFPDPSKHPPKEILDIEKEKSRVSSLKFPDDLKKEKDRWYAVKNILDLIYDELPPIGRINKAINIADKVSEDNKRTLYYVMRSAFDNGALGFQSEVSLAVISSEPAREFVEGRNILVKNRDKFNEYRAKVVELCLFADNVISSPQSSSDSKREPNNADKKRLLILEHLKEEWDLEQGQIDIPQSDWNRWMREASLNAHQLESVLRHFQDKGLIRNFEFFGEFE